MKDIDLQNNSRLNKPTPTLDPLVLDPETANYDDIAIHAQTEQYLSENTINKRLRYLSYMEKHIYPVNLRHPTKENFIRHIRYRLYYEKPAATPHALRHEKLAIDMLLRAYGQEPWNIKLPPMPKHNKKIVPLPDIVRELIHYPYSKNKYTNKLYQYMFRTSYLIGMRMPTELANLQLQDIIFNKDGTAVITITETKKHDSQRTLVLPGYIATDPRQKTLQNWIEAWRPIKENRYSDDYLFIQPNGKPFTPAHLAKNLRIYGKQVWEPYYPYSSRHWSAIARLIDEYINYRHWNTYTVKNWHGHATIKSTEQYIKHAEQYYQITKYSWIQRVLKSPRTETGTGPVRGNHVEKTRKINRRPKNHRFEWKLSESKVWARRHPNHSTDRKNSTKPRKHPVLIIQPKTKNNGTQTSSIFFSILQKHRNHCLKNIKKYVETTIESSSYNKKIASLRPPFNKEKTELLSYPILNMEPHFSKKICKHEPLSFSYYITCGSAPSIYTFNMRLACSRSNTSFYSLVLFILDHQASPSPFTTSNKDVSSQKCLSHLTFLDADPSGYIGLDQSHVFKHPVHIFLKREYSLVQTTSPSIEFEQNHVRGGSYNHHIPPFVLTFDFTPRLPPSSWNKEMLAETKGNILISYPNTFNIYIDHGDIQEEDSCSSLLVSSWSHNGMSECFLSVDGSVFEWDRHPISPPILQTFSLNNQDNLFFSNMNNGDENNYGWGNT